MSQASKIENSSKSIISIANSRVNKACAIGSALAFATITSIFVLFVIVQYEKTANVTFNSLKHSIKNMLIRGDKDGIRMILRSIVEVEGIHSIVVYKKSEKKSKLIEYGIQPIGKGDIDAVGGWGGSGQNRKKFIKSFIGSDRYKSSISLQQKRFYYLNQFQLTIPEQTPFNISIVQKIDISILFFATVLIGLILICFYFVFKKLALREAYNISTPLIEIRDILNSFDFNAKQDFSNRHAPCVEFKDIFYQFDALGKKLRNAEKKLRETATNTAIANTTKLLSHEGRKPVQLLITAMKLMNLARKEGSDDKALSILDHYTPEIIKSSEIATKRFNDIMSFSSTSSMNLKAFNIQITLIKSLRSCLMRANDKDYQIVFNLANKSLFFGDEQRLSTAFLNIIENAIQASEKSTDRKINIATLDLNKNLIVKITNSGSYIPPEDREKIFENFYTKGKAEGTGLGLALTKLLIEMHGGRVACYSDEKVGTTFKINLPQSRTTSQIIPVLPNGKSKTGCEILGEIPI